MRGDGLAFVRTARAVREAIGQRHRRAHTLRVARMAVRLARRHGIDPERARTAAMLHDLARLWDAERLEAACAARGMRVDAFERTNPIVLHARISAELARERFGVVDEDVLSAIRKHTLADPVMTPLDTVVYLADGLEPGRAFAGRERLAALAERDLDGALRATLENTLDYLRGRGLEIAPTTAAAARAFGLAAAEESCSA